MRSNPTRPSNWLVLPILAVAMILAPRADAAMINIDVLVESVGGSGTFDTVLGTVQSFDNTGESATTSYNYSNFSYTGDDITTESDKSQIFFVMNSNGLNVFWVHDSTTDSTGGSANTTLNLMDPFGGTLSYLVQDEPDDTYSGSGTDTLTADQTWLSTGTFTDGYAAGGLNMTEDAGWMLFANFNSNSGLSAWSATSASGGQIDLSSYLVGGNSSGLRVKFQLSDVNSEIPEPGTLALFGAGLVGLVALRRRKSK